MALDLDTSRIPFGSFVEKIRNEGNNADDVEPGYNTYGVPREENVNPWFELFVVFLIFASGLVFVRYACIFFIDAAILCRYRRRLGRSDPATETPATDPTTPGNDSNNENRGNTFDVELAGSNTNGVTKRLLDRLTPAERTRLFSSVLKCREATELDLRGRRDVAEHECECECEHEFATATPGESESEPRGANGSGNGNGNGNTNTPPSLSLSPERGNEVSGCGACCPICIQDIQVGDKVCQSKVCSHLFHLDCIVDWLSTGSTLCPYCRRVILTEAMLGESLRKLRPASLSAE